MPAALAPLGPVVLAHFGAGPLLPLALVPVMALAVLYAMRARTLQRQGRPVPGVRQASFYGGLGVVLITPLSPLGHLSDELLLAHMAEHLLIADLGALAIVVGLTGPVLAPILGLPVLGRLRVLAHPAVAFPVWALDLYLWHLPALYQSALHHPAVHALEHALFVACGVNMWMALFGPLPMPAWFGDLARLVYIIAVRLVGAVLGNVFVWSNAVFYGTYARGEAYWSISPSADQSTAGAIMMVEGSILTVCLFAWLFLRSAREVSERQALLELAGARGVVLSEKRAARAVAAGRGAELRRRVEAAAGSAQRDAQQPL
ncbi:MAG TPA: cytochrome c oxidase assembly protein [Solirubrobacteraceae bacterium]|jgi:cytochrome c oxidase assembly factor CtaG|nr:cytochrome c oxidase assembly protein [Solirubrobacteraceae bacterium]